MSPWLIHVPFSVLHIVNFSCVRVLNYKAAWRLAAVLLVVLRITSTAEQQTAWLPAVL